MVPQPSPGDAPTIRLGLLGDPVHHSLSAILHTAAARAAHLRVDYPLLRTPIAELPARVEALRRGGHRGFNATAPLKVALLDLVDARSAGALRVGAINTVCIAEDGCATGHNTDVVGYAERIAAHWGASQTSRAAGATTAGGPAVVLGAGGAARAALVALAEAETGPIWLAARRPDAARRVADELGITCEFKDMADITHWLPEARLLIGCLPETALSPLRALSWTQAHADLRVIESGYTPGAEAWVEQLNAAGRSAEAGLPLLVAQGVAAFGLFSGHSVASTPVLAAVKAAARARRAAAQWPSASRPPAGD